MLRSSNNLLLAGGCPAMPRFPAGAEQSDKLLQGSAALRGVSAERHARTRGVRDQALTGVDDAALGESDRPATRDHLPVGEQCPRPEGAQVVDLQLERRERLAFLERR